MCCDNICLLSNERGSLSFRLVEDEMSADLRQRRTKLCSRSVTQEAARTREEWLNCLFGRKNYRLHLSDLVDVKTELDV